MWGRGCQKGTGAPLSRDSGDRPARAPVATVAIALLNRLYRHATRFRHLYAKIRLSLYS